MAGANDDQSTGAMLFADIRDIFSEREADRLPLRASGASTLQRGSAPRHSPRRRASVPPDPSPASRSAIVGRPVRGRHDQSIGHARLEVLEHGGPDRTSLT
jgi:hypothetical protein